MDIEKLAERLGQEAYGSDIEDLLLEAATALSTLQAENEKLKDQLYDGEGVNLVNYWMQQAKIEENGHRNCQAENEKLRAELEQVEKVWRGCEKCNGAGEYSRYAENLTKTLLAKYCPHCGRPLTDEAVQMVMDGINKLLESGRQE